MSPHGNPEEPATEPQKGLKPMTTPEPLTTTKPSTGPGPGTAVSGAEEEPADRSAWGLWEVFVRSSRGLSHVHAGSLHAPDAAMALRNARDLYTRRGEGVSIWVVKASDIEASTPDERDSFFDPAADKIYRHPTFYDVPDGVEHL